MAFKLSGVIDFDAKGAKSELAHTKKAVDGVKQSSDKMNRSHKASVRDLQMLATAANSAETEAKQLAAAERLAAKEATALSKANRRATANTANLMAQFNDIGVMMASGQSPLQLALQQGTQITQVIGPLGAAGAAKALGTAFVGMLNPISFVTIGAIAAAAAFSNWLTGSDEDVATFEDKLSDLEAGMDSYAAATRLARGDTSDLKEQFGDLSKEARIALQNLEEFERRKALRKIDTSLTGVVDEAQFVTRDITSNSLRELGKVFDLDSFSIKRGRKNRRMIGEVQADFNNLRDSVKGSLDVQIAAVERLIQSYSRVAKEAAGITDEEAAQLEVLEKIKLKIIEAKALDAKPDADLTSAKEMLQTLGEQNAIRAAANMFGEESAAVALLRKAGEKAILEEQLAQLDVSEGIKNEIRGAWEAGQVLNATEMSDSIKRAADEAKRAADEINRAVSASQKLASQGANSLQDAKLRLEHFNDPVTLAQSLGENKIRRSQSALRKGAGPGELAKLNTEAVNYGKTLGEIARLEKQRSDQAKAVKSGNRGTQKQVDALAKLIEKEQLQIALLRETDPLQKEMLRNREALAAATDQERAAVEAIIAQRINEQNAIERLTGKQELFKDTLFDAFDGMIFKGKKATDIIDDMANAIGRAVAQGALLGTGPLGSILGGSTGGGLLGSVAQVLFPSSPTPALAGGGDVGLLSGPGSGTSDDILLWGSSGEFMVNAKATKKHRHLLEAINSGGNIPGFAAGGPVAPSRFGASGGGASFDMRPQIVIENHSSAQITEQRQDSVDGSGRRQTRLVLADAVGDALTTPGGGAKRAMRNSFGLRPSGVLR